MKINFLGRELTQQEFKFYREGKCIACGSKIKPEFFECNHCHKMRTRVHQDDWNHYHKNYAAKFSLTRQVL